MLPMKKKREEERERKIYVCANFGEYKTQKKIPKIII